MTSEIDRLAGELDALASRDTARRIFGADGHGYARRPVDELELATLETAAGFALPGDYRQWMIDVGAGAGPDHGLWSPAKALQQMESTADGTGGCVRDPTHIAAEHIEAIAQRLRDGVEPGDAGITTNSIRGAVPIGHRGCNGYSYLVLGGAFAGRVFGECCDCIGEPWAAAAAFWPASAPATLEPPTFLAWLEGWLDRSRAELGDADAPDNPSGEARP